jgi:hypothetical protein
MIGMIVKSPIGIGIVKLVNDTTIIVQYEDGFERHDIENLKPLAPDELLNYWLDQVFTVIKTCSGIRYSELNAILPDCPHLETYINLLQRRELIGDIDSCYSILNLKLLNFIRRAKGDGWVSRTDLVRSEQFDDLTTTNLDFELQLLLNSGKIDITAQGDNYRAYT